MKKILSILACMMLVVVSGATLTACGKTDYPIRIHRGSVQLNQSTPEVTFENNSNLSIEKVSDNSFSIKGDASFMSQQQADAFWQGVSKAGDAYVLIELDYKFGSTISYDSADGEKVFVNEEGKQYDEEQLMVIVKTVSNNSDTFSIKVKNSDDMEVSYTINFTNLKISQNA